jgi:hypothetical protein
MSNYQETEVTGTAYVRANQIIVANPLEGVKAISYMEEQVINLSDGEQILRSAGGFQEPFTAENAGTEFPLINPQTGESIGQDMNYQSLYIAIYSLYVFLAQRRDAAKVLAP